MNLVLRLAAAFLYSNEPAARQCPECHQYAMIPDGGCWVCQWCGYSECKN